MPRFALSFLPCIAAQAVFGLYGQALAKPTPHNPQQTPKPCLACHAFM